MRISGWPRDNLPGSADAWRVRSVGHVAQRTRILVVASRLDNAGIRAEP